MGREVSTGQGVSEDARVRAQIESALSDGRFAVVLEGLDRLEAAGTISISEVKLKADLHALVHDYAGAASILRDLCVRDPAQIMVYRHGIMNCVQRGRLRAEIGDFASGLDTASAPPKIVLAAMPKSGSTFLSQACAVAHSIQTISCMFYGDESEQELYLPNLIATVPHAIIIQQHFRATEANVQLCQAFRLRPVVLVRNIFDCIVSMTDMLEDTPLSVTFFQPFMKELSRAQRLEATIFRFGHWYIEFFVSWLAATREGRIESLIVRYEEMIDDKAGTLAKVARFSGFEPRSATAYQNAVEVTEAQPRSARINKGIVGRGARQLTDDQRGLIERMADVYRDRFDLSPIGL